MVVLRCCVLLNFNASLQSKWLDALHHDCMVTEIALSCNSKEAFGNCSGKICALEREKKKPM